MAYVLIAEADALLSGVMREKFRRRGYRTRIVADFKAFRGALGEERPDVALVDETLPRSVAAMIEDLRRERATVALPIVLLSRCHQHDAIIAAFRAGVADYVVKPLALNDLVARVEAMLRRFGRAGDHRRLERRRRLAAGFSPWAIA